MTRPCLVLAGLLLFTSCTRSPSSSSTKTGSAVQGLVGTVAYSDPAEKCSGCRMFLCSPAGQEFPFLGPVEAKGDDNPRPVPVAFDPGKTPARLHAGDTIRFDLLIDYDAERPLQLTKLEVLKHGPPPSDRACPSE